MHDCAKRVRCMHAATCVGQYTGAVVNTVHVACTQQLPYAISSACARAAADVFLLRAFRLSKVEDATEFLPQCSPQCPRCVKDVIARCTCIEPSARMTAGELVTALNACIGELP